MRAIVLAGGFGRRLRAYTRETPKPLMELGGVPILEIIVRQLRDAGFERVTLSLYYRARQVIERFGDGRSLGVAIDYSIADRPLGTAGPLALIERPDEPCVVLNADLLTDLDYGAVHADHVASGAVATVVASRQPVEIEFGVLDVDGDRLRRTIEKPDGEVLVNAGVYCVDPAVWDRLDSGTYREMPALMQALVEDGEHVRVHVLERDTRWTDVGVLREYYRANREFTRDPERYIEAGNGRVPPASDPGARPAGLAALDGDGSPPRGVALYDADVGEEEVVAVESVLRSGWISAGAETRAFEAECARALGVPDAVAVSSGTAALHLAALALGLGPGDEVVVPALTFVASASAFGLAGARPVFCDVAGPHDLTLDVADAAARIGPRTRALVVVHYGGYAADMRAVRELARAHGLAVIEDAAHAPMVDTPDGALGTLGDVGCFSFYATKNLTMGEGGLVVARDPRVLDRVRRLRAHAIDRDAGGDLDYDVPELGVNYRPSELGAAIGRVQLRKLAPARRRRAELVRAYRQALAAIDDVELPFAARGLEGAHHLMPVLLPDAAARDAVRGALRERSIQTSVHYPPAHLLARHRALGWGPGDLPAAEDAAARELSLPLHPRMRDQDVELVVEALAAAVPERAA